MSEQKESCSSARLLMAAASSLIVGSVVWGVWNKVRTRSLLQSQNKHQGRFLFESSAPGKVIISGEHSVVYGFKAIVGAINRRSRVRVYDLTQPSEAKSTSLTIQVWTSDQCVGVWTKQLCNTDTEWILMNTNLELDLPFSVDNFRRIIDVALVGICDGIAPDILVHLPKTVRMDVSSELPIGCGLGSSASVSTALCAALSTVWDNSSEEGLSLSPKILKIATECERVSHGGKASGIDNAIAYYGGLIEYDKSGGARPMSGLNRESMLKVLIIPTGVSGSTKEMVTRVSDLKTAYPDIVDPILQSISKITQQIIDELKNGNHQSSLHQLFSMNHSLLCALNLSHPKIDEIQYFVNNMMNDSSSHGTTNHNNHTGLKITGAGGGGCLILPYLLNDGTNADGESSSNMDDMIVNKSTDNMNPEREEINQTVINQIKNKYNHSFTAIIGSEKGCEITYD